MTHTKGRVWVCWSHSQQAFHIEDEEDGLTVNREAFSRNEPMDYIILGVFSGYEDALKFHAKTIALRGGDK